MDLQAARDDRVLLRLEQVTKRFERTVVLKGVDLSVATGQIVVLLGASGSGKTTLLRLVAGIEKLDDGRILINGETVASRSRHRPPEARNLAMVFQDYALWPQMTLLENVKYALDRYRLARSDINERSVQMLRRVGLADRLSAYPHLLSGGEQQRVALARALVGHPPLVLFDEPLSNLDANLRERLRLEISALVRESGAAALYITHDQQEAFALADRIGVLFNGSLVQFGPPEAVYHAPATAFVARFTGLAGEIAGRVCGIAPPHVALDGLGFLLRCTSTARLRLGDRVRVCIRPSAVCVERDADADVLPARILDVAFRGEGYDFAVQCADGTALSGIRSAAKLPVGERVGLALAPEGCFAFPAADAGAAEGASAPGPRTRDSAAGALRVVGG